MTVALAAAALPLTAGPATTAVNARNEYEVKAAFLYNLAKFVEWPASAFPSQDAPFVIGVLCNDRLGQSLERLLAGKSVGGRSIEIRRWRRAHERSASQILFVGQSERIDLKQLLRDIDRQPILTVADMSEFAAQGGMIGLILQDSRLRFEINTGGTDRAHLKVSSRLLSLAHIVATTP